MIHVLSESIERRQYIYPDGFRSVDSLELVCSCGERMTADPGVTVSTVWDMFETHRKQAEEFKPDNYVRYPNQNVAVG